MANYVVIAWDALDSTESQRLESNYPERFQVAPNAWVIRTKQLSDMVSNTIFFPDDQGKRRRHLVAPLATGFSGWHTRTLWEWLRQPEGAVDEP